MKFWALAAGLLTGIVIVTVVAHRRHRTGMLSGEAERRYMTDNLLTGQEL